MYKDKDKDLFCLWCKVWGRNPNPCLSTKGLHFIKYYTFSKDIYNTIEHWTKNAERRTPRKKMKNHANSSVCTVIRRLSTKKKVHENVLVSPKCHQSITKVHPRRWPKKEGVVVTQKSSATKKTFPQVFCSCCSPFPPQVERYNWQLMSNRFGMDYIGVHTYSKNI